ncbi:hypothetical protein GP486_001097 [Trichoglossum hirsutum]|uniref:Uncharacterized protein n=1 Tax=Trichoglossum hirsutum TaxID=265104 RepID=A0A9P8RTF0_9PEZI|nr:hypothetical protein GP486_001097 [Trichoglossum hirsutum]
MPTVRARSRRRTRGLQHALSAIERLAEQQVQVIIKQEQHLSALRKQREIQLLLDPKYVQFQDSRERKREIRRQWHDEILEWDPLDNWPPEPLDDDRSLYDILSVGQLWTTWQYQAAYPNTAKFLEKSTLPGKSRSLVCCDSFFPTGEIVERWSSETPDTEEIEGRKPRSMPERMWDVVKRRIVVDKSEISGNLEERLPSRLLRIMDISPVVATILLASTPKNVASNISPFLERYLTFSNFGKASMQSIKSETMNTFIFEYHFAFYYVTKGSLETHLACSDARKVRNFSWFGERPDSAVCSRHIYEEQMSFILAGHGHDIYTCYQLGEMYFNGTKPSDLRTFVNSPTWTPSTMFLSWIAMALHHVGIRWHDAIAAVDAQIASEEAVVFHRIDNFDLSNGAKDLKISTLRTYFWALEAYKLFEERLGATVDAWEQFQRHSLDKVNDGRNSEDYSKSVEFIELSIARLKDKIEWVRRKSEQVLRLRDGLFYVQSLSDTSVTIHQGDNIRMLTYFTILFLPLSFSTSIFGMQSILPSTASMKTFSIVLSAITISTVLAMFIFTGALQTLQRAISGSVPNAKHKLFKLMLEHPPKMWGKDLFHNSRVSTEKLEEQLRLWMYLAFLVELCFMRIPVHEVKKAVGLYGLRHQRPTLSSSPGSSISLQLSHSDTVVASSCGQDTGEANPKSLARRVAELQAERKSARKGLTPVTGRQAGIALFTVIRIFLLFVWVPLILLEYVVLIFCCPFMGHVSRPAQHDTQLRISKREQLKHFFAAPLIVLNLDFSQSQPRKRSGEHEHRSPDPLARPFHHEFTPPGSNFRPGPAAENLPPGTGRESRTRVAERIKNIISRPTFQAAYQQQYPSGPNPAAIQLQSLDPPPSMRLRPRGYSDVEGGISGRAGVI